MARILIADEHPMTRLALRLLQLFERRQPCGLQGDQLVARAERVEVRRGDPQHEVLLRLGQLLLGHGFQQLGAGAFAAAEQALVHLLLLRQGLQLALGERHLLLRVQNGGVGFKQSHQQVLFAGGELGLARGAVVGFADCGGCMGDVRNSVGGGLAQCRPA